MLDDIEKTRINPATPASGWLGPLAELRLGSARCNRPCAEHRIAIIGLGMAVTPHARSLIDLKDRVEVVAAFSPRPPPPGRGEDFDAID